MKRRKMSVNWRVVGFLAVVAVAVLVLVWGVGKLFHHSKPKGKTVQSKLTVVTDPTKAGFNYLVPSADGIQFDAQSPVFDSSKGVVDYEVVADGSQITISQQPMPADLQPWATSQKFQAFVVSSDVAVSEPVANGKIFFRQAIQNNAPAVGETDTIIYATNDILMFGQGTNFVSYSEWVKLVNAMQPGGKAK